jgi:hypothetical protein
MADVKNFLIVVNSGVDHPYNHYAPYVVAFLGKKLGNIEDFIVPLKLPQAAEALLSVDKIHYL